MRMICYIAALLLAAEAHAQTRAVIGQVRGPQAQSAQIVALIGGRLVPVSLGSGVQLVQVGAGFELRAASAPTASRASRSTDGSWTLPSGCTLSAVYRNGLRQWPSIDYTTAAGSIRFTDGSGDPSEADDIVIVECR